jgi:hypothetical protein
MFEMGMVRRVRVASDRSVKMIEGARAPGLRRGPFLDRVAGVMDAVGGLPSLESVKSMRVEVGVLADRITTEDHPERAEDLDGRGHPIPAKAARNRTVILTVRGDA